MYSLKHDKRAGARTTQAPPRDTSDNRCCVCGRSAPFSERDIRLGPDAPRTYYCRLHVPESWRMHKSIEALIELELAAYLAVQRDEIARQMVQKGFISW